MKRFSIVIFSVVVTCTLLFLVFREFRGHTIRHVDEKLKKEILTTPKLRSTWENVYTEEEKNAAQEILKQPFFYYGKGKQSFAFVSLDDNYVVKFLIQSRLEKKRKKKQQFYCFEKKKKSRKQRIKNLFRSFYIASTMAKEETGVLFVHTKGLEEDNITLVDKYGSIKEFPSKDLFFVLQKKAVLIKPEIIRLMYQKQEIEAKKRLKQIVDLLYSCACRGIWDFDSGLIRNNNIGFLQDRAIYIDTGKFAYIPNVDRKVYFEKDLKRLRPLHRWLVETYPDLERYLQEEEVAAVKRFENAKEQS